MPSYPTRPLSVKPPARPPKSGAASCVGRTFTRGTHSVWRGSMVGGIPSVRRNRQWVSLRRLLWREAGRTLAEHHNLVRRCPEPRCIRLDHCSPSVDVAPIRALLPDRAKDERLNPFRALLHAIRTAPLDAHGDVAGALSIAQAHGWTLRQIARAAPARRRRRPWAHR